jgi:NitT/TauT family transport system substrate-binding protein
MALRRTLGRITAPVLAASLLAACGGGDDGASADQALASDEPVRITVGALPVADMAGLHLADREGFFAEEGLDVTIEPIAGGAAGVPAMVSGELQFSTTTWPSVILAKAQGLDLEMVQENSGNAPGVNAILTSADAPYQDGADLEGTTIAVNLLGGVTEIQVRDCLKSAGLEPGEYNLVEIPFPDQVAAIEGGQIQAGLVAEPFVTISKDQGARVVVDTPVCNEGMKTFPVLGWATTADYASENPQVTAAFQRAVERGMALAQSDPAAVSEIVQTFTTLTPELAARMTQPGWLEDRAPSLERAEYTQDLMVEYGLLEEPVEDLESTIYSAG